jgi:outer membrane protein OmpA-like peptidoglycan-associated protein
MSRSHASRSADPAAKAHEPSPVWRATQELAAKSHATALEGSVRAPMETRFGAELSAVRIHADATAAESARTIGAAAYTIGRDIVFGAGRYQPHSGAGQQLLAHELAHVVQQSRGGSASPDVEARADHAADQATQGRPVSTQALGRAPVALQAKPDDSPAPDAGLPFPTKTLSGFALNSAAVTRAHSADIDSLAWSIALHLGMRKNGRATIYLVGHTDRSGDEKLNQALGQSRADTTRAGAHRCPDEAGHRQGQVRRDRQQFDGGVQPRGAHRRRCQEREEPARGDQRQRRIAAGGAACNSELQSVHAVEAERDTRPARYRSSPRSGG